jgi:biopolymer transport protein ExbD
MQAAGNGEMNGEINVTPMIDVLLVLLVIFMLTLQLRMLFSVNVPPPEAAVGRPQPEIVLDLDALGGYAINRLGVSRAGLEGRLRVLYKNRPTKLLFVRSAGTRPYKDVIDAMDVARAAGVEVIGYMP